MNKKDVGLRIRVNKELRNEFLVVCRTQDRPATQILRKFMKHHIEEHPYSQQDLLFDNVPKKGIR